MPQRNHVLGLTIDGPGAKALDDAIYVRDRKRGGFIIEISITDVAASIKRNSHIDRHAFRRAFTRYFESGNDPMIPIEYGDKKISLIAGSQHPSITVTILMDRDGMIERYYVHPTLLDIVGTFIYADADTILHDTSHALYPVLYRCNVVTNFLIERRKQQGSCFVYDLKNGWKMSEEGILVKLRHEERYRSYIIVQQFMTCANEFMAHFLATREIPAMFRNHCSNTLPHYYNGMLESGMMTNGAVTSLFSVGYQQILRQHAFYSPHVFGHGGLHLPFYGHFTSPIRRYVDLVNQRILHAAFHRHISPYSVRELERIAEYINTIEQRIRNHYRTYRDQKRDNASLTTAGTSVIAPRSQQQFFPAFP